MGEYWVPGFKSRVDVLVNGGFAFGVISLFVLGYGIETEFPALLGLILAILAGLVEIAAAIDISRMMHEEADALEGSFSPALGVMFAVLLGLTFIGGGLYMYYIF
jgi:hypothetical protein